MHKRYARQVGLLNTNLLIHSHVLIAGCGGLGNLVATYLATAGVGMITLVDYDTIDITNLNRQITYSEVDIGKKKCDVLKTFLLERNSGIKIDVLDCDIENITDLTIYDLVIDCLDNSYTKVKLHSLCHSQNKPSIFGSVIRNYGQVGFLYKTCINCAIPELITASDSCERLGVIGPFVGIIASYESYIALKYLSEKNHKDIIINISDLSFYEIELETCNHKTEEIFDYEIDYNDILEINDYQIFDIREFISEEEIIANSVYSEDELDKTKKIFILCDTGQESILKTIELIEKGYDVKSIKGGIKRIFTI